MVCHFLVGANGVKIISLEDKYYIIKDFVFLAIEFISFIQKNLPLVQDLFS